MHISRRLTCALGALVATFALTAPALAGPVAINDASYTALGRVFPDPLAGCQLVKQGPCDPNAQGNVAARSFVGLSEFQDALRFLNSKPEWQRYLEVYVLDGKFGPGSATRQEVETTPSTMFAGNDLRTLEFTPSPAFQSAGLPTVTLDRSRNDLIIVRVTDETVPDAGKKRMALSLSIHGIERAGAEGGIRTIEDLVTAATAGRSESKILPANVKADAPSFADTLKQSIVYFTFPNPDGWARGSFSNGGASFQRYNGNGVDPNRDYLDIGYSFRGYSGNSEPETRAFKSFYLELLDNGKTFQAGDDLHGQPFADALSYTLMPHGKHDLAKDTRIREAVKRINLAQYEATKWSPIIQANDKPVGGGPVAPGAPACADVVLGDACPKVYAQTWGSVYDTINYTTTGTLGDWFDSAAGLNADGIDNEMSFSHLDKNTNYEPQTEQLHVTGNRAIILSHLADIIDPMSGAMDAPGPQGYVPNARIVEAGGVFQPEVPAGTTPQAPISQVGTPDPSNGGRVIMPFTVKAGAQPDGKNVFNGGMRVDVTTLNAQAISTGAAKLSVQCRYCNDHVGAPDTANKDWTTIADDYNQSPIYLQAGVTVAVNRPQAQAGDKPTEWRAVVALAPLGLGNTASPGPVKMAIEFSSGPATDDGSRGGDKPPVQAPVDVANTDFFSELNQYIPDAQERFQAIDPKAVLAGTQSLDGLKNLVLADNVFPGATTTERNAWLAKVETWVKAGGNLVMTDAALLSLPTFFPALTGKVKLAKVYVGQVSLCKAFNADGVCTDPTLADPLNKDVAQRASRFNSGMRRQTFEPTPLGFAIQNATGRDFSGARQYDVDAAAFKTVGGRISATSASDSPRSTVAVTSKATMGELKLGAGTIRVAGALLPQPDASTDHPLGLVPYAVTYTGYIMACNLLNADCTVVDA